MNLLFCFNVNYSVPSTWTWSLCRPLLSTEFGYYSMWRFYAYLLSRYMIHIHCIDVAKCPNNILAGHKIVHYFTDKVDWLHWYIINISYKKNNVEKSDKRTIPYGWMVYHWIQKVQGDTGKSVDSSGWIMILYKKNRKCY